jgi:hypothetical protein
MLSIADKGFASLLGSSIALIWAPVSDGPARPAEIHASLRFNKTVVMKDKP